MEIIGIIIILELLVVVVQLRQLKQIRLNLRFNLQNLYELIWVRTSGGPMDSEQGAALREKLDDFVV